MANDYLLHITSSAAKVTNGNPNQYYSLDNISGSDFWNNVKADGGDLRLYHDDTDTRLPIDIVFIDSASQTGELHFYSTHSQASTSTTYRLEWGDSSLVQPDVTGSFGRNAVWQEFEAVFHLNETGNGTAGEFKDSTGNGYNGTGGNGSSADTPITTTTNNPFGREWQDFENDISDYIDIPSLSAVLDDGQVTFTCITQQDSGGSTAGQAVGNRIGGQGWNVGHNNSNTSIHWFVEGSGFNRADSAALNSNNHWLAGTTDASNIRLYVDGIETDSDPWSGTPATTTNNLRIGDSDDFGGQRAFHGRVGEVKAYIGTRSTDYLTEEYNQQSSNDTFWTTGAASPISITTITPNDVQHTHTIDDSSVNPLQTNDLQSNHAIDTSEIVDINLSVNSLSNGHTIDSTTVSFNSGNNKVLYIDSDASLVYNGNSNLYLNLANINQTDFWNNVKGDGGNLRIFHDDTNTQLPIEVATINTGSQTGQLYFHSTHSVANTSERYRLEFGNLDLVKYADDATYGKYNVWQDYDAVYHDISTKVDSTGDNSDTNDTDIIEDFIGSTSAVEGNIINVSFYAWPSTFIGNSFPVIRLETGGVNSWSAIFENDGSPANGFPIVIQGAGSSTGRIPSFGTQYANRVRTQFIWNTNDDTMRVYRAGSQIYSSNSWTGNVTPATSSLYFNDGNVNLDDVRIKTFTESGDAVREENVMETNNTNFWTVGNVISVFADLTANDLQHNQTIGESRVVNPINPTDVQHGHTIDVVTLSAKYDVTTDDLQSNHILDSSSISQAPVIPDDLQSSHTIDESAVTVNYSLQSNGLTHNQTIDESEIVINLFADDLQLNHTIDESAVSDNYSVTTNDVQHNTTLDNTSIVTKVETNEIQHGHTVDTSQVTVKYTLSPDELRINHTTDEVTLDVNFGLTSNNLQATHTIDSVLVDVKFALQSAGLTSNTTIDQSTVQALYDLVGQELRHTHTLDEPRILGINVYPNDLSNHHTIGVVTVKVQDPTSLTLTEREKYTITLTESSLYEMALSESDLYNLNLTETE